MASEDQGQNHFKQEAAKLTITAYPPARDAVFSAMAREAVKDVRNTVHQVFFGCGEGVGEPGAPLNPTQGEIAADRRQDQNTHRSVVAATPAMPSPSDIAYGHGVHGPDQPQGRVHGQEGTLPSPGDIAHGRTTNDADNRNAGQVLTQDQPGWANRIEKEREKAAQDGNESTDQNERAKGRSLPEEQREQKSEQERGGRGR